VRFYAFGDVIKVWVWGIVSLLVGLWLTPLAYNGGKALSELSGTKDFNGVVNRIAAWSGPAGMEDFFRICWPLTAAMLLFPLIEWLRLSKEKEDKEPEPLPKLRRARALQALIGFVGTFGCFLLIGFAMVKAGWFDWESNAKAWRSSLLFDIGIAVGVSILIEVFFRRVMLGIFLKELGAKKAIALAALMFGGIPFMLAGFGNTEAVDDETLSAMRLTGMVLVGELPARIITVFVPCFAFGIILGLARWRTASAWLPAGLLLGWLLAERFFSRATHPAEIHDRLTAYLSAGSVHTGIIPLLGVIAVGGLVHLITKKYAGQHETTD
jgi:membrane protease YdiL (CAAX protease family)